VFLVFTNFSPFYDTICDDKGRPLTVFQAMIDHKKKIFALKDEVVQVHPAIARYFHTGTMPIRRGDVLKKFWQVEIIDGNEVDENDVDLDEEINVESQECKLDTLRNIIWLDSTVAKQAMIDAKFLKKNANEKDVEAIWRSGLTLVKCDANSSFWLPDTAHLIKNLRCSLVDICANKPDSDVAKAMCAAVAHGTLLASSMTDTDKQNVPLALLPLEAAPNKIIAMHHPELARFLDVVGGFWIAKDRRGVPTDERVRKAKNLVDTGMEAFVVESGDWSDLANIEKKTTKFGISASLVSRLVTNAATFLRIMEKAPNACGRAMSTDAVETLFSLFRFLVTARHAKSTVAEMKKIVHILERELAKSLDPNLQYSFSYSRAISYLRQRNRGKNEPWNVETSVVQSSELESDNQLLNNKQRGDGAWLLTLEPSAIRHVRNILRINPAKNKIQVAHNSTHTSGYNQIPPKDWLARATAPIVANEKKLVG